MATPTFPEDELARLKRETVAEIIEARDNDRALAQKAFQRSALRRAPLRRATPGGPRDASRAITRDDVCAFYQRHVVQGNVVVGVWPAT